ncbi:MAG TPA: hypothetical protein VHF90_03570 [Thermoleophilaceae bacterium]|nr:hypothetical protein [Thermoleophilaceae bacterium]
MAETFGIVVIAIAVVAALAACASYAGSGRLYRGIGRSGLSLDEPELRPTPQPGSAAWLAEAEAELRQLLDAKSARSEARGDGAIDVEAELGRLSRPARSADPALRAEVRDLVVATNERRARRGQPPLDVEAEVDRRLADLGA